MNIINALKAELKNLKKNATAKELRKLSRMKKLYPNDSDLCLYGVMTGNCWSERAEKLIRECCTYVSNSDTEKLKTEKLKKETRRPGFYSPFEVMLFHAPKKQIRAAMRFLREDGDMPVFDTSKWEKDRGHDDSEENYVKI